MQDIETRIGKWLEEVREEYIRDVIEAVDIPSVSVLGEGEYSGIMNITAGAL